MFHLILTYTTRNQEGVSLTATDRWTGVGPFCYGQITWEDGPSPRGGGVGGGGGGKLVDMPSDHRDFRGGGQRFIK